MTTLAPQTAGSLETLPWLRLNANWHLPPLKLPHLLITGLGAHCDSVAQRLVVAVQREGLSDHQSGRVAEASNLPRINRSLRFLRTLRPGHRVAADVVVRAQGADLYVRFDWQARTRITFLRWGVYGVLFLGLWSLLYGGYFASTDAFNSLAHEYARKYWTDPVVGLEQIRTGWHVDPATKNLVPGSPMTMWDFYEVDPKLFITSLAGPPSIIAGLVGAVLLLIPKTALRHPCRWLGWPTPDEFLNAAMAHAGWVHRILSDMLLQQFGVSRDRIIELQS